MKKLRDWVWGAWSVISALLSPMWLYWTVLNLTGMIYKHDPTMDEGTAFLFGILMLLVWLLFALLPGIMFYRMRKRKKG